MSGIESFINGLDQLGIETERRGGLVLLTLDIVAGDTGQPLAATDPPPDFPNVPPHWLHLPKDVQLIGSGSRDSELGPDWLRWSRPHPNWVGGEHASKRWLAHVRSLILYGKRA